ncbi:MAG TPA: S8 family serine peptidase, partial [Candidatus Limnocylindrales bacterium]
MRFRSLSALGAFAVLAMLLLAVSASGAPGDATAKTYIVQMLQAPVVAYEGGEAGLAATKPARGEKINPNSAAVKKYADYLVGQHDAALKTVGGATKVYDYTYTYNGFAAKLTDGQKAALEKQAAVLAVTAEEQVTADTSSTPAFLGLTAPGGLWEQLGGPDGGKKGSGAGEDVVIGIVDSGIWPESGSFSDRDASGKLIYQQIPGWHGKCTPGEDFAGSDCNQKLIGAQYFNASWGGDAALEAERPWEFMSPRDYNGHGTHTASTSGGNYNVATTGPATVFGSVSGIAPRARIAAYKALWSTQDASTASGFTGDLVAAIDQAVADGVDVINYSISGSRTNFADPVMISFLFAADAGIFVAASAGNSGPASSTVAHPSPWMTTVAAGTHNRDGRGSVTLGNGTTYTGASVATPVGPAPLVDSVNVGKTGADATEVALCYPGTLDPAKVAGKIVLCLRGVIARVDKSLAVQQAGGLGMVLYNDPDSSLNADFHFVPTVHVDKASGLAIKAYIAGAANPTATINASEIVFNAVAPLTASFSSRGPLLAGGGDVLKPDVIAPGQDILAAVAPPGNAGRDFNLYSGTSMSSPHVAGLAALLMDKHPGWSPMAVKSALMTTGYDVLDGGTPAPNTNPVLIFRQGAGHVQPNKAADPGLVYDSSWNDWLAFLCGTTNAVGQGTCTALKNLGYSTDASDMNVASIAIGDLAGVQTVKRKVTNVGSTAATYNASVTGMAGINTVVSPSTLQLNPGQTGTFTVTFTTTTATLNAYTGGQLTWSDGTHTVRSPIVVRPVALAAPAQVTGTGGTITYPVTFGYTGPFTATPRGLVPAATESRTVTDDPTDSTCSLTSPNAQIHTVAVPAGTTYARFSLFDAFTDGNDDLDLCVFNAAGTNVGSSGSGTSAEEVNLLNPAAGDYRVVVQGWGTDGPDAQYTLFHWVLGSTAAGNMTVSAPASATLGQTANVELTFSGLAVATKYLGS